MHIYAVFRGDSTAVQLLGNVFVSHGHPPKQPGLSNAKGYVTIHRNFIHTGLWYKYNHGTARKYTHHSRPNIERARVLTVLTVLSLDHA